MLWTWNRILQYHKKKLKNEKNNKKKKWNGTKKFEGENVGSSY